MKSLLISGAIFSACIAAGTAQAQTSDNGTDNTAAKTAKVTFMDSKLFDGSLSKALQGNNDEVEVDVIGKISLNSIPSRMDRWLTAVAENGEVQVKAADPVLKPKFLFDLAQMVYAGVQRSNEERMIEPVKKYSAVIYYGIDANGESKIERIVFRRRK